MKRLYICRHGESELNVQRRYAGQIDTPLTDHGRLQAHETAAHAAKLQLDLIVASPLVRALETAQIIAHEIGYSPAGIIANDLFVEQSFGSLAGQSYDIPANPAHYPDIESTEALRNRALAALEFLHTLPADTILVVSHGSFTGTLRSIVAPDIANDELPNAHIVQLI